MSCTVIRRVSDAESINANGKIFEYLYNGLNANQKMIYQIMEEIDKTHCVVIDESGNVSIIDRRNVFVGELVQIQGQFRIAFHRV